MDRNSDESSMVACSAKQAKGENKMRGITRALMVSALVSFVSACVLEPELDGAPSDMSDGYAEEGWAGPTAEPNEPNGPVTEGSVAYPIGIEASWHDHAIFVGASSERDCIATGKQMVLYGYWIRSRCTRLEPLKWLLEGLY
jgi:hypothetical protein